MSREKRKLGDGVFVVQEKLSDPTRIRYEIVNETDASLDMLINLEGSENLSFREDKMEAKVQVEPQSERYAGTVFVTDPRKGWKLACKFSWTATRQVPADESPAKNIRPDADTGAAGADGGREGLPDVTVAPQRPADEDRRVDPHIHPRETDIPYPEDQREKARVATPHGSKGRGKPAVHRKPLEEGVTLLRTQHEHPTRFTFEVENTLCEALEFTLSISGSANMAFGDGTQESTTTIEPETTTFVGECSVQNPREAWSLNSKFSWKRVPPSKEYQQKKIREQEERIRAELEAYRGTPLFDGDDRLTLDDLINECKKHGVKFIDTEFLPAESQIFTSDSEYRDPETPIVWRRASEIFAGKDYDVFVKGVEPADIEQGRLGDCWLMCALASLAERGERVMRLFQRRNSSRVQTRNEVGAYQVRLCKNGEWWQLRLDDYFPCLPGQGPIFSRSQGNELWVLLIEKAFAKICGCYDMLRGGLAYEALMDLTGCPTRNFKLEETGDEELWEVLRQQDAHDNIMTCSVPGEDKWSNVGGRDLGGPGLVSGHAYTMLSAKETSQGHRLVCLRNPWGEFEWSGDWSDNSSLWTPEIVNEVGATFDEKDGLFWMSYKDFRSHFSKVNVCHVLSSRGARWEDQRIKGRFEYSGKSVACPHFTVDVPDATEAWVSIHQNDERILHAQPYVDLGFVILQKDSEGGLSFVQGCGGGWNREAQLQVPKLAPGSYVIVPFTSGHRRKAEETRPLGKMFESEGCFTTGYRQIISEIFMRYDEDMNGYLSMGDFGKLYKKAFGKDLSEDTFAALLEEYDSTDEGVSRDGFRDFLAQHREARVIEIIRNLGYDDDFNLVDERRFVVSLHSERPCTLHRHQHDPSIREDALTKWVEAKGLPTQYDDGNLVVYQLSRGTAGTTLAIKSNYDGECHVTLDCTKSENVGTTADGLVVEKTLAPGTLAVFHHLFPIDSTTTWRWAYRLNIARN